MSERQTDGQTDEQPAGQAGGQRASGEPSGDPTAAQRMRANRARLKARGFKLLQTQVPVEVDRFLSAERDRRRVRSKGDVVAALVREIQTLRQAEQES